MQFRRFLKKLQAPNFFINWFRKCLPRPFQRCRNHQWCILFHLDFVLHHCAVHQCLDFDLRLAQYFRPKALQPDSTLPFPKVAFIIDPWQLDFPIPSKQLGPGPISSSAMIFFHNFNEHNLWSSNTPNFLRQNFKNYAGLRWKLSSEDNTDNEKMKKGKCCCVI